MCSAFWGFSHCWWCLASYALSNPSHSPSNMAHVSTSSSLAQRKSNAVVRLIILYSSPCSPRELVRSPSVAFASCNLFGICRAVNRPFLLSISGYLVIASPTLGHMPFLGRLKPPICLLVWVIHNSEPRDLPFGSPWQISLPGQARGACWFIW